MHRYHAVIQRDLDTGFMISDMSGPGGNGVRINGVWQTHAQLTDGDTIELGKVKLRFTTKAAAQLQEIESGPIPA